MTLKSKATNNMSLNPFQKDQSKIIQNKNKEEMRTTRKTDIIK